MVEKYTPQLMDNHLSVPTAMFWKYSAARGILETLSLRKEPSPKVALPNLYQPQGQNFEALEMFLSSSASPPDHAAFKMHRPNSCCLYGRQKQDQCHPHQIPFMEKWIPKLFIISM